MSLWLILAVNSIALGGLLFLLSAGFSLIFGLMRIPNLMHGAFFMLGAYIGVTILARGWNFWIAALVSALIMAVIGGVIERFLLRRLAGEPLPQVLMTLGFAFIIADLCLMIWTGDPIQPSTPAHLAGAVQAFGLYFPIYRLVIVGVAVLVAIALWVMVDWTRLGAMIRAGVDDAPIARVVGIKVSQLFTLVFVLAPRSPPSPASWVRPICRSIPASISTCCRSRSLSSFSAAPEAFWARWSAASLSGFSTISARRCFPILPMSSCSCRC